MKYKVGDKVKLKSKEGLDELKRQLGDLHIHPDAYKNAGSEQTILECYEDLYRYDASSVFWHESYFEGLVEEPIILNGTEVLLKLADIELPSGTTDIWECPNGYVFKDENGNVINATKIVLEKKKKEYPKTYKDCCKVLNIAVRDLDILDNMLDTTDIIYSKNLDRLLNSFRKLLICRDAYWKIAGEEMGLSGSWKPDFASCKSKYAITYYNNVVSRYSEVDYDSTILVFPTEEMRDAFYENFKELINSVKELL